MSNDEKVIYLLSYVSVWLFSIISITSIGILK